MRLKTQVLLKTIIAIIAGELALILLTTLAQEVLVDGVNWNTSSKLDLFLGGSATFLAGMISGFIASKIVGNSNYIPHIFISVFITVETFLLLQTGRYDGPLWFDILASVLLILSIWMGYILFLKLNRQK